MRIVVAGTLASRLGDGVTAWTRLAWTLGIEGLGADVRFVEALPSGSAPVPGAEVSDPRVRFFEDVCRWGELEGRAALVSAEGRSVAGVSLADLLDFADGADLLVNLGGHLGLRSVVEGVRSRAYVDLEPGLTQLRHADGEGDPGLERHDTHFTVGTNIGAPWCRVPTGGFRWFPMRTPVLVGRWALPDPPPTLRFTTVAGPTRTNGRGGPRDSRHVPPAHDFDRFIQLPRMVQVPAEVAMDAAHPSNRAVVERLKAHGWIVRNRRRTAGTPAAFQDYVCGSAAELSASPGIYVQTRCGWVGDHSARYLAAGRPVILQDTGLVSDLPSGEGLVAFQTPEQASRAAREVLSDYERHRDAARHIVREHFASEVVLTRFCERALGRRHGRLGSGSAARISTPEEASVPAETGPVRTRGVTRRDRRGQSDGVVPSPPRWARPRERITRPPGLRPAPTSGARRALVCGSVAGTPWQGGATWVVLNYVLGLHKLGWDVHLLEEVAPEDVRPRSSALVDSENARYFEAVVRSFGLEGRATLLESGTGRTVGLGWDELERVTGRARLLINLSGNLRNRELGGSIPVRAYVDLDPVFTQLRTEGGGASAPALEGHTHFVTVGLDLGTERCAAPTGGVDWVTTLPPVVLKAWPPAPPPRLDAWTTVASWEGDAPARGGDVHLGQRADTFRDLVSLPLRVRDRFEVALAMHGDVARDRRTLIDHGWTLLDPKRVAGTPGRYHHFVRSSAAEIGVAKGGYVTSRCGWFSDRSACYLAAGRPVVAQDTGLSNHLPVGSGLLVFGGLDQAVEAVRAVRRDYARHARAARRIAESHLDSDRVLSRLLREVNACTRRA